MFKTRLLSGIVLVAAALVLIITGGDVLLFSTLLISYIGMFELYRIFHVEKELPGIVGYLAATVFYCNLKWAFSAGSYGSRFRIPDGIDVCLCIYLSEI